MWPACVYRCLAVTVFASIPSPPISGFEIGPLRLTFYGMVIAVGVALAWTMTRRRYVSGGGDSATVERVVLWMVVLGFVGARVAYVSTNLDRYVDRWWGVFAIWEGGIALYGGLTMGAIAAVVLSRRWGGDFRLLTDAAAPAIPLAQAIGRWGNYFNQELFGTPTNVPWGLEIDPVNRPAAYPEAETFHPTFLYESLWNLALVGFILWAERRYPAVRGRLIGIYLIGYAFMRFLLELIRTDTTFRFLGLSRNGWVSLGAMVVGAVVMKVLRPADRPPLRF